MLRCLTSRDEMEIARLGDDSRKVVQYLIVDRVNPTSIFNMVTLARAS